MLEFAAQPATECSGIDRLIDDQLLKVRARLESMRALERQLTELRKRCDAHHAVGECGILHELVAAARPFGFKRSFSESKIESTLSSS